VQDDEKFRAKSRGTESTILILYVFFLFPIVFVRNFSATVATDWQNCRSLLNVLLVVRVTGLKRGTKSSQDSAEGEVCIGTEE
jgi:hypothetical protein